MSSVTRDYAYTTPPPGYRLPAELRLGQIRLQVSDLQRSLSYYQKVIGLRVFEQSASRAVLGAADDRIPLIELNEKPGVSPADRRGRLGLYHFAILLPNRASLGSFLGHLAALGEYAGMSDHFVSEALYLTDPDGLGIEVYADKPRSSWEVVGSQLGIGSSHLDVNDLIAASENQEWNGAPAGTTIGHVHLYVDSLEASEKFYHKAVGFDKMRLEFPGALFMSAGGYHHHLGTNTWAATSPRATDEDARLLEWTVMLHAGDDLQGLCDSLEANGFKCEASKEELVTVDPWGTRVRFQIAA